MFENTFSTIISINDVNSDSLLVIFQRIFPDDIEYFFADFLVSAARVDCKSMNDNSLTCLGIHSPISIIVASAKIIIHNNA